MKQRSRGYSLIASASVFAWMASTVSAGEPAGPNYYYYFKERRLLPLDVTRVALFRPAVGAGNVAGATGSIHPRLQSGELARMPPSDWRLASTRMEARSAEALRRVVTEIAPTQQAEFVSPVFFGEDGGPIVITPRILVAFQAGFEAAHAEAILAESGAGAIIDRDYGNMKRTYRVAAPARDGFDVLEAANRLAERPEVLYAEPEMILSAQRFLTPNDPLFGQCWGLNNTGQFGGTPDADMDAPEAWDISIGDPSIIVVIMDAGIEQDHPDLNQHPGNDFTTDPSSSGDPFNECDDHGTAVGGCVSATINNSLGLVGVAPGCRVASARVFISSVPCSGTGSVATSWMVDALTWAEFIGARVTNTSLGLGAPSGAITTKFEQTRDDGMVHFAAAGNGGVGSVSYPASIAGVNAIAALAPSGARASFSQWGPGLDFSAPGESVSTTDRTGSDGYSGSDYVTVDGTSFASPYSAGVAALILSVNSSLSAADVELAMQESAVDLNALGYDTDSGWGFVNAYQALLRVAPRVQACGFGKITAPDAVASGVFGRSVAISMTPTPRGAVGATLGGTAVPQVYFLERVGFTWSVDDFLSGDDTAAGDSFGESVSVSGDRVVVGAYQDDLTGPITDAGSAYVFHNNAGTWSQNIQLTASDAAETDQFGRSVSIDGDTLVVGAPQNDDAGGDSGSAYVFVWNGSTWAHQQKLTANDAAAGDTFGFSVSISGDVLLAAATGDDDRGADAGAAYVFERSGTVWTQVQKLTANDGVTMDRFGWSVALSGTTALIGAPFDDDDGSNSGAAYVFEEITGFWTQRLKLHASDANTPDNFGLSVSLSGGTAVVGAPGNQGAGSATGSAYVFRRTAASWVEESLITLGDAAQGDNFGDRAAVAGDTIIVAAKFDDDAANNAGSISIYAVVGDCNRNASPDVCDLRDGTSLDVDLNGVPDECQCLEAARPVADVQGIRNRYLSFSAGTATQLEAIRVTFELLPLQFGFAIGRTMWVGPPTEFTELSGRRLASEAPTSPRFWGAELQCTPHYDDWTQYPTVHVYSGSIVPSGQYAIQAIADGCSITAEGAFSDALNLFSSRWGDAVGTFDIVAQAWRPADGAVNITSDVTAVLAKFANRSTAPSKPRSDLEPDEPDQLINISDVTRDLDAFRNLPYPFAGPPAVNPCAVQ